MAALGGGGNPCSICEKTVYPAETIQFDKKPYHIDCFSCSTCHKKLADASKASKYEEVLYCKQCFERGGFAQKQKQVQWTKKDGDAGAATSSRFGGGGTKCTLCEKTAYPAETISFDKKPYHADCFKCKTCDKKITPAGAGAFEDVIYCKQCFAKGGFAAKQRDVQWTKKEVEPGQETATSSKFGGGGTKCHVCNLTVYTAETLSFDKKPFHPACFKCSECSAKIAKPSDGSMYEDKVYCGKCWKVNGFAEKQAKVHVKTEGASAADSRFTKFGGGGTKCYSCTKTVYSAEAISYEKHTYHADCLLCKNCNKKQTVSSAQHKNHPDGNVDVYCSKCWSELGLGRAELILNAPAEAAPVGGAIAETAPEAAPVEASPVEAASTEAAEAAPTETVVEAASAEAS